MIDLILLFLGILGLLAASYSDIKTTEVPDWICYSLIISGLSLRFLEYLNSGNFYALKITLLSFLIFFIIGNIMYYIRQWGGGDAKLIMAIAVIFAVYPSSLLSIFSPKLDHSYFPIAIFINILIVGMIYTIIFTVYLSIKNIEPLKKEMNLYFEKTQSTRKIFLILSILLIVLALIIEDIVVKIIMFSSSASVLFLLYFWIYIKSVEKACMYKKIQVSNLLEGDWLTQDVYKNNKLILRKPKYGLTKDNIGLLKKNDIKIVEVKQGIVFVPVFLISVMISLIFGNIVNYII